MNRNEALKLLGLDNAATALTPEIVQTAFRCAMVAHHPDTRADQIDLNEHRVLDVTVYQEARKVLLDNLSSADLCCKLCGGLGKVPSKMGYRACVACKGTGDRQ